MAMYQCYAGFKFTTGNPMESIACTQDGSWSATPKCEGTLPHNLFWIKNPTRCWVHYSIEIYRNFL